MRNHRKEVKSSVLAEQSRQFLSDYQHRDEQAIARVAQEKSRNARVFAALLGQADAAAAKQEEFSTKTGSLVGKWAHFSRDLLDVQVSLYLVP
jgi:K+/H+ antiporter YhaU regulatory subunit KhtT